MVVSAAYRESYPRTGDVAILCEGDLIGYEANVLDLWADQRLQNNPLVDIWPCGTAGAIFGFSDAIGRSRPLMVIEDRDFRTQAEASSDCNDSKKDRERRDVRVLAWRAWARHEIENYLLEPEVVLPVMADVFACTEQDVQDGLSEIIPTLTVYQAAQYALYRARRSWGQSDPSRILPDHVGFRPTWNDGLGSVSAPDRDSVRAGLQANVERWQSYFVSQGNPQEMIQGRDLLQDFDARCEEWQNVGWDAPTWRMDWAGKEVLQWLRVWLTARYGWWDPDSGERPGLQWEGLSRSRWGAQDRPVETALRPLLVARLVAYVTGLTDGDIYDEWSELEKALRAWKALV